MNNPRIAQAMAWLTECNLATLTEMRERSRTPKYSITRQENICRYAVELCRELEIPPVGLRGRETPRLARALKAPQPDSLSHE